MCHIFYLVRTSSALMAIVICALLPGRLYSQHCDCLQNRGVREEVWIPRVSNMLQPGVDFGVKSQYCVLVHAKHNDTLLLFINKRRMKEKFLITDSTVFRIEITIDAGIDNNEAGNSLSLVLMNAHECMTVQLKNLYRIVDIHERKTWKVDFSNYFLE